MDSFLQVMGMEPSTTHKKELEDSVNKLFDEMLIEGGTTCNFTSLVERFVTTIIQTLITHPLASQERYDKVIEALDELIALSVYYNMPKNAEEKKRLPLDKLIEDGTNFFARILAHANVAVTVKAKPQAKPNPNPNPKLNLAFNAEDNENVLDEIFELNRYLIDSDRGDISFLPIGDWAKLRRCIHKKMI